MNLLLNNIQSWTQNGYAGTHLMNLAGTNNVALAGGLRDTDSATAGLQEFIPEVWGASIMDYMEKILYSEQWLMTNLL